MTGTFLLILSFRLSATMWATHRFPVLTETWFEQENGKKQIIQSERFVQINHAPVDISTVIRRHIDNFFEIRMRI